MHFAFRCLQNRTADGLFISKTVDSQILKEEIKFTEFDRVSARLKEINLELNESRDI